MLKLIGLICLIAVAVAIIIGLPFTPIWAMNTLFPALNIQYTFFTWVAVLVLIGAMGITVNKE